MKIEIKITELIIETTAVVGREDNIKGFFVWKFKSDVGQIIIRGGTIREKEFGTKRLLSCEPPCFKAGIKYFKAFIVENLELYRKICDATIEAYCAQSGNLPNNIIFDPTDEICINKQ